MKRKEKKLKKLGKMLYACSTSYLERLKQKDSLSPGVY
jgi:hypothetical protein